MPPVMGAAAFSIAEYLQIPYAQVALAAFVPAILYYVPLLIQVDLLVSCARRHSRLVAQRSAETFARAQASSTFVVPLTGVGGVDVFPQSPTGRSRTSGRALGADLPDSGDKIGWPEMPKILTNASRGMLEIAAITGTYRGALFLLAATGLLIRIVDCP